MDHWFEDKFEREKIRKYTKRRLNPDNFFRKLSITNWIIIINVLIFIIYSLIEMLLFKIYGQNAVDNLFSYFALQPNLFFAGRVWTLFTSMFMHGGYLHIFVNMFSLFFVGNFIEKIIGRKRFLGLYILSGLSAGLFFAALSYFLGSACLFQFFGACFGERIFSNPNIYAVGASGAIFSLVGLLAILTPKNKVYLIAGPLIAIIIQAIASSIKIFSPFMPIFNTLITIYFIFSIISMLSFNSSIRRIAVPIEMSFWLLPFIAIVPLIIIGLFVELPIGNMAHLGGLLAGIFYGLYLKRKYRKKTEMISKIFSK